MSPYTLKTGVSVQHKGYGTNSSDVDKDGNSEVQNCSCITDMQNDKHS